TRAILARSALPHAADQRRARISPKRLGEREAKIAPCKPDVLEHAIVEPGEKLEVAAVPEDFRRMRNALHQNRGEGANRLQHRERAVPNNLVTRRHGSPRCSLAPADPRLPEAPPAIPRRFRNTRNARPL